MVKSTVKFFLFLFLLSFTFVFSSDDVYAARKICTNSEQLKLEKVARRIEFTYTLKFNEKNEPYFEVMYFNLQAGVEIKYGENTYVFDNDGSSGMIKNSFANNGEVYNFEIYASYGYPCVGELLYTKKLDLPKYNIYYEYGECIDYPEFSLCNKWYDGEIENEEKFYEELEKYKKSLEKPEEKPPVIEKEKNIFEKFIEFYLENLMITIPVTVILFVGIVVVVVKKVIRRKHRVKIDI